MKAILTRYLPFTDTKPSRIKASAEGVPSRVWTCNELDHPLRSAHTQAAYLFAIEHNWPDNLASGGLPNGDWAHCFRD